MQRMLYISYVDYANKTDLGIIKKIEGQIRAFSRLDYDVDHLKIVSGTIYMNEEPVYEIISRLGYWITLPGVLANYFRNKGVYYNLVYIRKDLFSPWHYRLFSELKQKSTHILLEVPTYPYRMEVTGKFRMQTLLLMDRITNRLLKRTVSFVVTTQEFDSIFGIKTIKIRNGYDFSRFPEIERRKESRKLRFVSVANFNYWHGVDRLLYGIHHYNEGHFPDKREIYLHLVGAGSALDKYKEIARRLKLENIIFHGTKNGTELDSIYEQSDIGVGALGLYRRQSSFQSLLKNVEYCFYGIPFIIGNPDIEFKDMPFVLEFPNDSSPIDLQKVISWWDNMNIAPASIQNFGKQHFSWERQIELIIRSLFRT